MATYTVVKEIASGGLPEDFLEMAPDGLSLRIKMGYRKQIL